MGKDADNKKGHWAGVDLGGTKMLCKLYDVAFEPLARVKTKTQAHRGDAAGLQKMVDLLRDTLDKSGLAPGALSGIGVGSPGPLDLERGMILELPNLGWKHVPLRSVLKKAFGCPVQVINDVDAGVYGEYRFGVGRGKRCVLGVFPGTGIGGGCVYEGRILRGARASCMEIGHIPTVPNGLPCGCGRLGCLETVASRLAIAAAAVTAGFRGQAPSLVADVGFDLAKVRSRTLAKAIAAGDTAVETIIRQAAYALGRGIATAYNLLAPDVVILGGGLVEAMPALYLEATREGLMDHVMHSLADGVDIQVSTLGDDAAVLGAAAWARECET